MTSSSSWNTFTKNVVEEKQEKTSKNNRYKIFKKQLGMSVCLLLAHTLSSNRGHLPCSKTSKVSASKPVMITILLFMSGE